MATTHKERLNQLITALGLSKNKFAKAVGTSSAVVSNITTSDVNYGVELAEKIISTFPMVSPTWLLSGFGEMMLDEPHLKPPIEPHLSHKGSKVAARPETGENSPGNSVGGENEPIKYLSREEALKRQLSDLDDPLNAQELENNERYKRIEQLMENRRRLLQRNRHKLEKQLFEQHPDLYKLKSELETLPWLIDDVTQAIHAYFFLDYDFDQLMPDEKGLPIQLFSDFKDAAVSNLTQIMPHAEAATKLRTALVGFLKQMLPHDTKQVIDPALLED